MLLAASSTLGPVFWILSPGDLVAIGIAIIANVVTIVVTNNVQKKEDARSLADRDARDATEKRVEEWRRAQAKYDRIQAHFAGIVFAANTLEALVSPLQWKADKHKSAEELADYRKLLDRLMQTFADAASSLTVEGMTEQVAAINNMVDKFFDFRRRLYLMGEHEADTKDNFDEMFNDSEAIKAARKKLEEELPAILQKLLPDKAS